MKEFISFEKADELNKEKNYCPYCHKRNGPETWLDCIDSHGIDIDQKGKSYWTILMRCLSCGGVFIQIQIKKGSLIVECHNMSGKWYRELKEKYGRDVLGELMGRKDKV